jgi:glycosyltransferase involved in cell wall biosynthesis
MMPKVCDKKNVVLSVVGKFHAFSLATELANRGMLNALYCAYRTISPPPHVPWAKYCNRIDIGYGAVLSTLGIQFNYDSAKVFDQWVAKKLINKQPNVLHGWNGCVHTTFLKLQGKGWKLCVERSCPHNQIQNDLLVEEAQRLKLPYNFNKEKLKLAIEELYLADVIVAPSNYSARSYDGTDLLKKVIINPLGANFEFQYRANKVWNKGLIILMVGNSFLRKGTHYLVEAFKQIENPNAELWIRGDVPESYRKCIVDKRVKIIPPLLPTGLKRLYKQADVFVQPSIDEGFGMTVIEALAYGLPLVVTENVGAADLLDERVAVKVKVRDSEEIAKAIVKAQALPSTQFDTARKEILTRNTWGKCVERMIQDVYNIN